VPGTAIYLTNQRNVVPSALALNLKHNGALHERLVLPKVTTERAPRVAENVRVVIEELSKGIRRVELRFGFAEKPDVPMALRAHAEEVGCDPATASHREWFQRSALADLLGEDAGLAEIHKLYRCHDRLLVYKQAVFEYLTERWRDLFNISYDVLLYDLTSTYFEADPPFPDGDKRRFRRNIDDALFAIREGSGGRTRVAT